MSRAGVRPPSVADERTQLLGWLQLQRQIVRWKCEGLSDEDAYRVVLPSSPLMTMAGLVSHLRWTEHCWFQVLFLDAPSDANPQFDESGEDLDMRPGDVPLAQLLAEYTAECEASDAVVAAHDLDDVGRNTGFGSATSSLRWMLLHMLEETARHAGHADVVRELVDGRRGYW